MLVGRSVEENLRAQTPQGERIALARSEMVSAGTELTFTILCLDPGLEEQIAQWLHYGKLRGLGAWRNSGMGRFTWKRVKEAKAG